MASTIVLKEQSDGSWRESDGSWREYESNPASSFSISGDKKILAFRVIIRF